MNKILHPFDMRMCREGRFYPVFLKVEIKDGTLSISGVEGPTQSGNAHGSCGQIDMEFDHRYMKDNDKRYEHPIMSSELRFSKGWNSNKWLDLLDVWKNWHLNDMHAECEHQRALGWTYEEHHDKETYKGENCPVCGYSIGSAWLKVELPQSVIDFLVSLPDTDRKPAWV